MARFHCVACSSNNSPAAPFFDRLKLDDPQGALSVHLTNGIWGTLSVGFFADSGVSGGADGFFFGGGIALLISQIIGVVAVGAFTITLSFIVWYVIKLTVGLRVDEETERAGLDVSEMGMEAYPGFQLIRES